jgi:outer membrane receptor protein involved in Fe transport
MRKCLFASLVVVLCGILAVPAAAQQTTGNITGRVTDQQGGALPGVTVTATQANTGFSRTVVTDGEGVYRLSGLPIGIIDLTMELTGFATLQRKDLVLNVSQTLNLDIQLGVASMSETVTVSGDTPLLETTSSSVGGVVDVNKIEQMPLNGRQFANLAMTVAGVAMGFHSDPTKSSQQSPQIAGGNGRNVNYQIDGGDNNDDTVGGLLQLFPLEAIQEFNFVTQRYKAEYGRSNGGVMNIVTKSGTNNFKGSFFTAFRDKAMNAKTESQILSGFDKQDYRRYQYGGSFGGPILQNRAHFFAAAERTQQDSFATVNTLGMFPEEDGTYLTPYRENLFTVKASINMTPTQFLTVRYGRNTNSQVYGINTRSGPDNWGDSENTFNSINVNHNWVLGGSKLNEFVFQFADFANYITARTGDARQTFPNGVEIGYNVNTPQKTLQDKWQFRDDFSWSVSGMGGLGHNFKAGVNYINEPTLAVNFNTGSSDYTYVHLTNDIAGPLSSVSLNNDGGDANLPMKQFGVYFQDDWRITSRVTLNVGLRYDLVTGFAIDQSIVPNFQKLQGGGQSGLFNGVVGFQEWGPSSKEDYNNIQPRIGVAWDVFGTGRDLIRAGWGIYYDFGYTNANILFPGISAQGGSGVKFTATNSAGLKNPDGSFYVYGQPISNISSQNQVANPDGPFFGSNVAVPRVKQPFTNQYSVGWSHQLTASTVIDVDYVHVEGKDLGVRWQLNTITPAGTRRYASLGFSPANPTMNMSIGASKFDGFNIGMRRRMDKNFQLNGWYQWSNARGLGGLGLDELTTNLVQDATDPLADVQWGPSARTDARHKVTISAVINLPWGIYASPIFRYRSALPIHISYGYDNNADGVNNDIYTTAYQFTGTDDKGNPSYEDIGACDSINCGRGAALSQFNLRVSKVFKLPHGMALEAIGEIFNLFNAINPNFPIGAASAGRFYTGTKASPTINTVFMKPTAYSGDAGQPEQRVGQIGFRFTF